MARVRTVALAFVALLAAAGFAGAQQLADAGRTPEPHPIIPKAAGDHCVRPVEFMRRSHMTMLKHQRDETVHEGVRGGAFSIAQCVACHAVSGADGQPVSYADPKHFCRSCHDYAAVTIDCFECHASKPAPAAKAASLAPTGESDAARSDLASDLAALDAYLKGVKP